MTPEERAEAVLQSCRDVPHATTLWKLDPPETHESLGRVACSKSIASAIREAVAVEKEACAKVASDRDKDYANLGNKRVDPRRGEASRIAADIRSRA